MAVRKWKGRLSSLPAAPAAHRAPPSLPSPALARREGGGKESAYLASSPAPRQPRPALPRGLPAAPSRRRRRGPSRRAGSRRSSGSDTGTWWMLGYRCCCEMPHPARISKSHTPGARGCLGFRVGRAAGGGKSKTLFETGKERAVRQAGPSPPATCSCAAGESLFRRQSSFRQPSRPHSLHLRTLGTRTSGADDQALDSICLQRRAIAHRGHSVVQASPARSQRRLQHRAEVLTTRSCSLISLSLDASQHLARLPTA